jgi:hypothetical protein
VLLGVLQPVLTWPRLPASKAECLLADAPALPTLSVTTCHKLAINQICNKACVLEVLSAATATQARQVPELSDPMPPKARKASKEIVTAFLSMQARF